MTDHRCTLGNRQVIRVEAVKGKLSAKVTTGSFSKFTHGELTNSVKRGSGGRHWKSSIA